MEYRRDQEQLRARAVRTTDVTVVHLTGEVDLATNEMLKTVLRRETARSTPPRQIRVDLSRVTFLDASGLGVLLRAQKDARARGIDLAACHPQGLVRRIIDLTGLAGRLCVPEQPARDTPGGTPDAVPRAAAGPLPDHVGAATR